MASTNTIALLGTGIIGGGMAANIAKAGIPLRLWNRTPEKAEGLGGTVCASPAEAVEGVSAVVTALPDGPTTDSVIREAAPASGTVWMQSATVGIEWSERLAATAAELGLVYVDAPVLGTKGPAQAGQLTVLASGPEEAREVLAPVLDAVSAKALWLGDAGAGSRLKLVCNSWVLTIVEGVAEALTLAGALDLDPQLFLDAVAGSGVDAPYVQLKGKAMLAGDFEPQFPLWGGLKDARLICDAANTTGVELAVAEAVRNHLERADAAGHHDLDVAATYLEH